MAGYSKTPLPKKLGIKPGHVVALVGAALRATAPRPLASVAARPVVLHSGVDFVRNVPAQV